MKGDRVVKRWALVVLGGIVLSCSAAVRADTLLVTQAVPFYAPTPYTVTLSFDWNTITDVIANATASGGFRFGGVVEFGQGNGISLMNWTDPAGDLIQWDSEYVSGTTHEVLPTPGTYPVIVFESCGPSTGINGLTCSTPYGTPDFGANVNVTRGKHGNPHNFADPVATPEPATIVLGGSALLLLLAKSLRRF